MPPALLWWVSGLNTLLVLDGHDRIAAASAEDTLPAVVVLAPAPDPAAATAVQRHLIRDYESRVTTRIADVTRRFAGQLNDVIRGDGRTRAWPLPGGTWDQQAARLVPGWRLDRC